MRASRAVSKHSPAIATLLIILLWVAFALRIEHLTEQSLWFDEASTAVSLFYGRLNPLIVEARAIVYFLLIAPFVALVPTDFGLRWPSVMAGMVAIALSYRIGKRLHGERAGLIAALLITISPHFIHYSREARYYSIVPLVALIAVWLALRLNSERRAVDTWFIPVLTLLAGLHLLAVLWIAVLLMLLALRRVITGQGARWDVLIGAALAPTLMVIALHLLGTLGAVGLAQGVAQGAVDAPQRLMVGFFTTGWGMTVPRNPKIVLLVLFLVLVGVGLTSAPRPDRWRFMLLGSLTVLPVAALIALTFLYRPIFLYRYLMPSFAMLILLTSVALAHIRVRWIAGAALGILVGSGMLSLLLDPPRHREDWRGAAAYLEAHLQDGDQVFVCRARAALPMTYYLPELQPYYLGNIPVLIRDYVQSPPSKVIEGAQVWIVQHYSAPCTLDEYRIDASGLPSEPTEVLFFERAILLRYAPQSGRGD